LCALKLDVCSFRFTLVSKRQSKIVVGSRIVRIQAQRLLEFRHRFVPLIALKQLKNRGRWDLAGTLLGAKYRINFELRQSVAGTTLERF